MTAPTRTRRGALALAVIAIVSVVGAAAGTAHAQSAISGPSVALDRYELTPGDHVGLTISGFRTRVVTMSICGNEARRGSVDCNMQASRARELDADGAPTAAGLTVAAPPTPCPCIVRVSSSDNREIAVAPITLVGHPVADVVGGAGFEQPLAVAIVAHPARRGLRDELRASLGGAVTYDVTVRVENRGTVAIDDVGVASTFTRTSYDDVRTVEMPSAGRLAPGETWEHVAQVEVPSLTFGRVEWRATASGFGPSVTDAEATTSFPVLLVVLGVVLFVDIAILCWRLVRRVRRRRVPAQVATVPRAGLDDGDVDGWSTGEADDADDRSAQLVS